MSKKPVHFTSFHRNRTGNTVIYVFNIQITIQMTVCSCHVTYAFQSESTLYSCLNVKEILALLEAVAKSEGEVTATGFKPRTT